MIEEDQARLSAIRMAAAEEKRRENVRGQLREIRRSQKPAGRVRSRRVGLLGGFVVIIIALVVFGWLIDLVVSTDDGSADSSVYARQPELSGGAGGLSNANIAWHAKNTYGYDCDRVVSRGAVMPDGWFIVSCVNDLRLRVYPRRGSHPKITRSDGSY